MKSESVDSFDYRNAVLKALPKASVVTDGREDCQTTLIVTIHGSTEADDDDFMTDNAENRAWKAAYENLPDPKPTLRPLRKRKPVVATSS